MSILTEDNGITKVDIPSAYKYGNILAGKAHTFGTYLFAAMNDYNLGSSLESCEMAVEFYKTVAERNSFSTQKYSQANAAYKKGFYKTAALLYLELAEEGHQFADINSAILFYNHDIFSNSTFNYFNSFNFLERQVKEKDSLSFLYMADTYYTG